MRDDFNGQRTAFNQTALTRRRRDTRPDFGSDVLMAGHVHTHCRSSRPAQHLLAEVRAEGGGPVVVGLRASAASSAV